MYMVAQALIEHCLGDRLSLLVGEHPVGKLAMPCQAVSAHLHAIGTTPVGYTVGTCEIPHALLGMYLARFHRILGSNAIEVLFHHSHLLVRCHIADIKGHTNSEIVLVSVLVTRWVFNSLHLSRLGRHTNECTYKVQTEK